MNPEHLVKWRKGWGYTQKALADVLGVDKMTVYRWEKAMREIPPFLHLALGFLELKGPKSEAKGARRKITRRKG